MRIACYPNTERWNDNLMLNLMNAAIERHGGTFASPRSDFLDWDWLWANRKDVDVIHLHWTAWHYLRESAIQSSWAMIKFVIKLVLLRLSGYRLVWTMHNVYPHERPYPFLDVVGRLAVAHLANAVVVHCNQGRAELRKRFFRKSNVYMAYLGHFIDVHPCDVSPGEARRCLGVEAHAKVLLFFGAIRPYKGLDSLIRVFAELNEPDLRLIIAGVAWPKHIDKLTVLAAADDRISVIPELIPAEDAQIYFAAADIVVLPFAEILTSASVLTAMSFAKPVVAPAMGCLPEIITADCGILYDPAAEGGLQEALLRSLAADYQTMGERACVQVQRFGWDEVGRQIVKAYSGT